MDYEHSELLMYKNMLMVEAAKYEQALAHLDKIESEVGDKRSWKETKGLWLSIYI